MKISAHTVKTALSAHPPARVVLLAAGGTGGHIFPAEALGEVLRARGLSPQLVTDRRFHQYHRAGAQNLFAQIPVHTVAAAPLSGSPLRRLRNLLLLALGTLQAAWLIRRLQPLAVVGFGGYPSFPTMLAACLLGRRTILHEQNSVLGKVNRLLAARVGLVATSYRDTRFMPAAARLQHTGNPVRAGIMALAALPYEPPAEGGMLHLLVLGGSQGARIFSDVLPEALALLPEALRARIRLDQQCRADEIEAVRARTRALGLQADLAPFFTDMPARLSAAHLVISRAGASSVAELTVAGRPAILVPLPSAADNHQFYNAQAVEDAGAGWVMPQEGFTPQALATRLEMLLRLPARLAECAKAMRTLAQLQAAERLADLVVGDDSVG